MDKPEEATFRTKLTLLAIFLAIPFVAFVAARGIEWKLDSGLRQALVKEYPDKAAQIANMSVSKICRNVSVRTDKNLSDVCDLSDKMGLMKLGAILAVGMGLALLGGIKLAGVVARRRRRLLLWLFAPGLHLTMLALSGLTILHAGLGMAAIYYGESALIERVHYGIMLGLGIGATVGVISLIRAQFGIVGKATTRAFAKVLQPEDYRTVWEFVTGLASKLGAERPERIVAGLDPNFYVTEAKVLCLDGKLQGRTMYVSLPLCRILSVDELKAVLGHELAHYKGLDTRFSQKFYPIYRGATQGLLNIAANFSEKGGAGQFVLLPAFTTLKYFLNCFAATENEISRERELIADSEAAKLTSANHLASALVKVHGFSGVWPVVRQNMKDAIEHGKALVNASSFFALLVNDLDRRGALASVAEEGPVHPTDTHPPLTQRLENLKVTVADVINDSTCTSPEPSAYGLFGDAAGQLEAELTDFEQALMIRTGEATAAMNAAS